MAQELVAMKDWSNPVKAHLRGAIALINSRQSRTLPGPISSTIYNAVQTQIVCFPSYRSCKADTDFF